MINGKITDFIDQISYGQEIVFLYNEKKYFIQGWWTEDKSMATLTLVEITDKPFAGYLWEYSSTKMSECAEAFLAAPIWDDKNFLQIEEEVTWTEW